MSRERPIIFSGESIPAILAGQKTQTRRPVKPQPPGVEEVTRRTGSSFSLFTDDATPPDVFRVAGPCGVVREMVGQDQWRCPYGSPGDRLWVKETWAPHSMRRGRERFLYKATRPARPEGTGYPATWHSSIFMPRIASRLTLEVTVVRVERLQAITEEDAQAEGVQESTFFCDHHRLSCREAGCPGPGYRAGFAERWDGIHGAGAFDADPWVWVVSFRRVQPWST